MQEILTTPPQTTGEAHLGTPESIGPSIKFVAWEHDTPEDSQLAAEAVKDCEVVAIELVGFRNDKQRARYNSAATTFVSSAASEQEKVKAQKYLRGSPATLGVLQNLQDTDKKILTIDVNKGTVDNKSGKYHNLLNSTAKAIHRIPTAKAKAMLRDASRGVAEASSERESRDIEQLQQLTAQYDGTDTKIGVLVGGNHTPVRHALHKMYPVEYRTAAARHEGQSARERYYFLPDNQMVRHYRFLPGVEVPESIVDRTLLHYTQFAANQKGVAAANFYRARRIENITDAEVSDIVAAIDGLKAGLQARLRPKRTLATMDATIEAKLKEAEARGTSPTL